MVAHVRNEANIGPHGFPMDEATDPRNQFAYTAGPPVVDWVANAVGAAKQAYYEKHDHDPKKPLNREGHLWVARKR